MRLWKVVSLAILMIVAVACSGAPSSSSRIAQSAAATPAVGAATPSLATFHGIIGLFCPRTDSTVKVTSYDPATGQPAESRAFPVGAVTTDVCSVSGTVTINDAVRRNEFNADFTKLAAWQKATDGGSHIGYVDTSGTFTDLTPPKGSSFGDVIPNQSFPVFNPQTGRLWFWDGNIRTHLGSVDPSAGPGSARPEAPRGYQSSGERFDFSADGITLIDGRGDRIGTASPDGKLWIYYSPGDGWYLDTPAQTDDSGTPGKRLELASNAPTQECWPKQFIDPTAILCVGGGLAGGPNGLFALTLNSGRTALSEVALLPETSNSILDATASQDGRQIAFVGVDAGTGTPSLYVTGRASRAEPRKIADFDGEFPYSSDINTLLGWT